jgi:hypothetical protein
MRLFVYLHSDWFVLCSLLLLRWIGPLLLTPAALVGIEGYFLLFCFVLFCFVVLIRHSSTALPEHLEQLKVSCFRWSYSLL